MSRRAKRSRTDRSKARTAVRGRGSRRGWWIGIAAVLVVMAASTMVIWSTNIGRSPAYGTAIIPDPDTTEMQSRIAQRIREARAQVVNRPNSADAWGRFGEVCHTHVLLDEAATCYRRAAELAPKEFRWPYLLAIARRDASGDAGEVATLLEQAIALRPTYALAYYRLGQTYAEQENAKEAEDAYAKAIQLDPNILIARRALGQLSLSLGDVRVAVQQLERVLRAAPRDGPTLAALAQAYMRLGDRRRAEAFARRLTRFKDTLGLRDAVWEEIFAWNVHSSTARRKALRFVAKGDFPAAVGPLKQVEAVDPDDPYIQLFLSQAYLAMQQTRLAETHFNRMLKSRDDIVETNLPLTLAHLDQGVRRLLEAFANAADTAGDNGLKERAMASMANRKGTDSLMASLQIAWGNNLVKRGDPTNAITHYESAAYLDPDSATALVALGQIMESMGRRDRAIEYYRRAIEKNPNDPVAQRLKRLEAQQP